MREISKGTCAAIENDLSYEDILENITLVKVHDLAELIEQINSLDRVLSEDPKIKLVVIDSIAFFFRSYNGDYSQRGRILLSLAQNLRKAAHVHHVAIVVTNQMTTKIQQGTSGGSVMVPSLGESWGHSCTHRIILSWQEGLRNCWLCKSSTGEDKMVPFTIVKDGIRSKS